jgi:predicted ABC-type ATPase
MWLIAGPNGSGKTTLAQALRQGDETFFEGVTWINPDDILTEIINRRGLNRGEVGLDVLLEAAQTADKNILACIETGSSFVRETVLSTSRLKPMVQSALDRDFKLGLIFIILSSSEDCVERVSMRVKLGGHNVAPEKVRERWQKSIQQVAWFAQRAEIFLAYDNSELNDPILLYEKRGPVWMAHAVGRISEVDGALSAIIP